MPEGRLTEEELIQAFEEVISAAERLPDSHASATKDARYMHHVLSSSYPIYEILYKRVQKETSIYPIIASGLQFVRGVAGELKRLAIRLEKIILDDLRFPLGPVVKLTGSFGNVTDLASDLFGLQGTSQLEPIPAPLKRIYSHEFYMSHLKSIPELIESYDQVWQIYNGTSADRNRTSLLKLRQVFDYLLCDFAPDDRVRASDFWKPKKQGSTDQVFVSERIEYTVSGMLGFYTDQTNPNSDSIAGLVKLIINLHESSIKMDKQGNLDEVKAKKILLAMDNVIKDWMDAVLIPWH
jgi:hypothetical protein